MSEAPNLKGSLAALETAERSQLIHTLDLCANMTNEWLRRQILVNNRIDLLATEVLGYKVQPFHRKMMIWQFQHPNNLQMAFRGAGKSTTCTVTKAVHLLLKNPNLRIVIASKTLGNAQGFLKEIKGHFENNVKLREIFGPYYDPHKVTKWDDSEITVLPKTSNTKEASITCVGFQGTIVSKHYDVEMSDDLCDEDNSRTQYMRDKLWSWYYSTLDPTIEPPDPSVLHRGERHRLGTRFHYDDIYGRWQGDVKNPGPLYSHTQIIPALDENERSPWPEKFKPEFFKEKKAISGTIIFNAQYQCNTEAMKGEIFTFDQCQIVADSDIPDELRKFMGVDLAISEDEAADHFAIVVIGVDRNDHYYVLDFFDGQLRFNDQAKKIREFYQKHDPIRVGIETNAYQLAQFQNLKDWDRDMRLKDVKTDKDKIARAWKLSAIFEDMRFHFRKNQGKLIDQLVLFPAFRYKDLFDALDIAVTASKLKKKKNIRTFEPGLL